MSDCTPQCKALRAKLNDQLNELNAYIDDMKKSGVLRNKNKLLVEQQRVIRLLQAEVGKLRGALMNNREAI